MKKSQFIALGLVLMVCTNILSAGNDDYIQKIQFQNASPDILGVEIWGRDASCQDKPIPPKEMINKYPQMYKIKETYVILVLYSRIEVNKW